MLTGMPADFRFHDQRHYLAPLLIASCSDIQSIYARMRCLSQDNARHYGTCGPMWTSPDDPARTRYPGGRTDLTQGVSRM